MNEQECLDRMVAPGTPRAGKYRSGVIQIHVTRACDKACFNCTQNSQLSGPPRFITPEQFEVAVKSLQGYWGVVGMFGGNPAVHPQFSELCDILDTYIPFEQRGLWCNNPLTMKLADRMRRTFNPAVSNLNVHLDRDAYDLFKAGWPECHPVGLNQDSRHAPTNVAMKDVVLKTCPQCLGQGSFLGDIGPGMSARKPCEDCDETGKVVDESRIWELISGCDINQHWSAMIGVFRGQLRAWFCEVAGAQAILHQDEPDYPDTGLAINSDGLVQGRYDTYSWWELGMEWFAPQVRKHCFDCGVPLRGHGELSQVSFGSEQVSQTHAANYIPKRKDRNVERVTDLIQLGVPLGRVTNYLQNSKV